MDDRDRIPRIGAAVALVLVAAACGSPAGQGAASPQASASASVPASAAPSASTAALRSGAHELLVSVPVGWVTDGLGVGKNYDRKGEVGIVVDPVDRVYSDACRSEGKLTPVGSTVDDLVSSLDAQLATDAVVSAVTLHGQSWMRVDLAAASGLDRAACRHGADGPLQIWADAVESDYFALAPGFSGVVLTTDVDGDRIVLSGAIDPLASDVDRAELESVIASIDLR